MAPRRTVRVREGERREDAAYDLLIPMGFKKKAIQQKIKELLKVYGGPDGWLFIEEGSYKLLIEQLLGEDCAETTVKDEVIANEENVGSSSSAVVGEVMVPEVSHASASNNAAAVPPRKRRPYHGWVGSTEDDVIVLSPAMSPAQLNAMAASWYSCDKCRRADNGTGTVEGEGFSHESQS